MLNNCELENDIFLVAALQRDLNLATSALLLTGQITIVGIFVSPGEFSVSLSGPLFGRPRLVSKFGDNFTTILIDVVDVIIAILLILDEIRVEGTVIGPSRFSVIATGPIFGAPLYVPTLPILKSNYQFFKKIVSEHYVMDSTFLRDF